ncbi:hypothetical protein Tco_0211312 [Tanacetum coccineum]
MEIMDREVKKKKKSRTPIVKVHWNPRRGPELTWEREDEMKRKSRLRFVIAAFLRYFHLGISILVINMSRTTIGDTSRTRSYIPKVSQTPGISPTITHFYKPIEDRCIHEGRVVDQLYYTSDHIDRSEQQYNLAYFFVKRIESARATPKAHLPYGMFLTRLFRHVMEHYPHLDNGIYNAVDRVMRPLALKQTRKPQSDRGKARHSVSSTSAHHNRGSSSHQEHDDGASCASTPSPTTYLNSLKPLD